MVGLPEEIIGKIMLYISSPIADILRISKYFGTYYSFRKLNEVSKLPYLCQRKVRHDYYKIYLEAFLESLGRNIVSINRDDPVFRLPTDDDFDQQENDEGYTMLNI